MKRFFLALGTAAAIAGVPSFALAAPAVDPQTTAAVKSMLNEMDMRNTMIASYAEMEKVMPQMLRSQIAQMIAADTSLTAEQKKQVLAKLDKAMPGMIRSMSAIFRDPAVIDEMMNELVPLYASNFTTAEINELAAFYRTPLGRKMTASMPKITAESAQFGQKILMPRMGKMMQDMMQELQKQ